MINTFGDKARYIGSIADLIRDSFKRGKYQDVILPLTVLRRLDLVLEPTKPPVLEPYGRYKDKLNSLDPALRKTAQLAIYTTSPFTFGRLLADAPQLAGNPRLPEQLLAHVRKSGSPTASWNWWRNSAPTSAK